MNKYHHIGPVIYNDQGNPVTTMPSPEWAKKVCGYMNKEALENLENTEKRNFSMLAHQMSVREELEEDTGIYDSSYHPNIELKAS